MPTREELMTMELQPEEALDMLNSACDPTHQCSYTYQAKLNVLADQFGLTGVIRIRVIQDMEAYILARRDNRPYKRRFIFHIDEESGSMTIIDTQPEN